MPLIIYQDLSHQDPSTQSEIVLNFSKDTSTSALEHIANKEDLYRTPKRDFSEYDAAFSECKTRYFSANLTKQVIFSCDFFYTSFILEVFGEHIFHIDLWPNIESIYIVSYIRSDIRPFLERCNNKEILYKLIEI